MELNLELQKAIEKIKQTKAKKVCLQLPDGLKPKAEEMQKELQKNTEAQIFFWMGSCFGACDVPQLKDFDLLIQFGHSRWRILSIYRHL